MTKSKSPKLDEFSGNYMPSLPIDRSEIPAPYRSTRPDDWIERGLAEDVRRTLEGREKHSYETRRSNLVDKTRLNSADVDRAIAMGLIFEWRDGTFSTLPEWAKVDPSLPATADFTSLAEPQRSTAGGQEGADTERLRIGLHGVQSAAPLKPHHVHAGRKEQGCKLCSAGVDHLRYLGVSRGAGSRIWTGTAALIDLAKKLANWKGLYARSRPNGSKGYALLTVEDERRLNDRNELFHQMKLEELTII